MTGQVGAVAPDLSRRRLAPPFNLVCCGRLPAAIRLDRRPDRQRRKDGWHRNSLREPHGCQSEAEAVSAFQRGAHGNIRGKAGRIKRA